MSIFVSQEGTYSRLWFPLTQVINRASKVPSAMSSSVREAIRFVVQFADHPAQFLVQQWEEHPYHIVIEFLFCIAFVYFYMIPLHKAKKMKVEPLSKKEEQMLLDEFKSEPFKTTLPDSNAIAVSGQHKVGHLEVVSRRGPRVVLQAPHFNKPTECLDLATFDYYSLSTDESVRDVAKRAVAAYGVGSCGPRGFYGTVKPHLDLEADIAKFLGVDSCIIYSFSFATVSTLIPCYSSRGDYIVMDDGVSLPVQEGCHLSRSHVSNFRHNDLFHLEDLMSSIAHKDNNSKKVSRRFVVTEGLFRNSGDICHLPDIIRLCRKHKFRLILEDSYGFGCLGATGRGTPEHFQIPTSMVDIYVGSMSNALGAVGGFCAGENTMIDHQRLAATGYVFSASLPPYMTAAASQSLRVLEEKPALVKALQKNSQAFRSEIRNAHLPSTLALVEAVDDVSPLVHIRVSQSLIREIGKNAVEEKLQRVVDNMQSKKVVVLRHLYSVEERVENFPAVRVSMKSNISAQDAVAAARLLATALKAEFK